MKKHVSIPFVIFNFLTIIGCGPFTFTRTRVEYTPYSSGEYRQEKAGLVVEQERLENIPDEFYTIAQECDEKNQLRVNKKGEPITTEISVLPQDVEIYKLGITNNTDHIIRFNSVVFRLFDPANNGYEPLDKNTLIQQMLSDRPCKSTKTSIASKLQLIKLIGRNTELLPNLTIKGYLFFKPTDPYLTGVWTVKLYEVPVETDSAGKVTKTERFEMRTIVKKFIETYRKEDLFAEAVKIETQEIE